MLFCEPEPGGFMAKTPAGWVPCTEAVKMALVGQPRVEPFRLVEDPGALRAFNAFIVPGITYHVATMGGKPEKVAWFDETRWVETGEVVVQWGKTKSK